MQNETTILKNLTIPTIKLNEHISTVVFCETFKSK